MNMVELVILLTGATLAVASLAIWFVVRRHRRLEAQPDTNPGLILPDAPGAVSPPMMGALLEGTAGVRDLMLSVIDLAVRGYISLKPLPSAADKKTPSGWVLQRTAKPARGLSDFETTLLAAPTAAGSAITLGSLFADRTDTVRGSLSQLRAAVARAGWFSGDTHQTQHRASWAAIGGLVILIGLIAAVVALVAGFSASIWPGLTGAALTVVSGLLLISLARLRPSITAHGDATRRQVQAYRDWLQALEPHDIAPEKATELFGTNIVSAMAFKLEAPFAEVFDTAIARHRNWGGHLNIDTDWLDVPPASLARRVKLLDQMLEDATRLADRAGLADVPE